MSTREDTSARTEAVTVRTLELSELGPVHGVTCDPAGNVWFAHGAGELVQLDPRTGRVLRRLDGLRATSGTAHDGTHLWQIVARDGCGSADEVVRVEPESAEVVHRIPAPAYAHCSGMAWVAEAGRPLGVLWIGGFHGRRLVKVDAATGEVLKELASDRLVTGVEWLDGELVHGAWEREEEPHGPTLRRVDPESGRVLAEQRLPDGWAVSGVGLDRDGRLWCGGSASGGLRAVRFA